MDQDLGWDFHPKIDEPEEVLQERWVPDQGGMVYFFRMEKALIGMIGECHQGRDWRDGLEREVKYVYTYS